MNKALFLDRDGTIIHDEHYLSDPKKVRLIYGVGEALKKAQDAGFLLIVVTNQSGIGRGFYTVGDYKACNRRMEDLLWNYGVYIDDFYFAPEHPDIYSKFRKPSASALRASTLKHDVILPDCYMIGDKYSDVQCGLNADVKHSFMVLTGHGAEEIKNEEKAPKSDNWSVVADLPEAIEILLKN